MLATADFRLRITIWSLCDRSVFYIRFPKLVGRGLDFSADGALMALAERHDCKDSIGLFATNTWSPIRSFTVATVDLEDVKWAPHGGVICAIDTVLQYQVRPARPTGPNRGLSAHAHNDSTAVCTGFDLFRGGSAAAGLPSV